MSIGIIEYMYVRRNGRLVKITKKSINAVSPSLLKIKRDAFERKKKTTAFKRWRRYQYTVKQKGGCYYCRRPINGVWVTDHIIPLFRGGTSAYTNLCVTCWKCNQRKGIRLLGEKNFK
jgi:5-methylcytosine-specific restriction endonuclease McrA